jgi:four helix bundle protein
MLPALGAGMAKPWDLFERTAQFAVEICEFCETLPSQPEAAEVAAQLRRAARGVASNYRAARRGRSDSEFIAKLGTVVEESDESLFWLQHLVATGIVRSKSIEPLHQEANELVAMFTAAYKTARANVEAKKRRRRNRGRKPEQGGK